MPSRTSSSSSSRAPLEDSRAANRSISASFSSTKASLAGKSSSSFSKKVSSSSSSSSRLRSASGKHRGRFDEDDDIAEEDENNEEEGSDSYDEEEENNHRQSNSRKPSGAQSKSMSRPPSQPASRQPSASNNANRSILARSNPNASMLMAGGNTSLAFQNSRVAALARSHAVSDASSIMRPRSQSANPASSAGSASDPNGTAPAPASLRVDTSSFEEWMKMATDNKINSTNTWSFALIDYFHDMSLLRNDSGDGSINFQKASCTLDGCVKVWTSRVDSVVVETGKLLSGLQDDIDQASRKDRRGNEDGDHEADDDDDEDATGTSTRKRKRNKEATLAKTFGHIQIKKYDLEFTVDPLFKKTSADFDEGGASGLLMNHLGVDPSMAVIFDASDVAGVGSEEDIGKMLDVGEDGEGNEPLDTPSPAAAEQDETELVDLSKLATKWMGSEEMSNGDGTPEDVNSLLARRVLCPTLCNFRFSKDDDTPFGVGLDEFNQQTFYSATQADTYYDRPTSSGMRAQSEEYVGAGFQDDVNPLMDGAGADVDFFGADMRGGMDNDDDDGNDFFDALESAPALHHGGPVILDGTTGNVQGYGPFDPSAGPSSELVMAMAFNPETGAVDGADGENGSDLFDYFDRRLMRNWAGPEHWKLSRVAATGPLGLGAAAGTAAAQAAANNRKEGKKSKEPFVIDFESEEGAVDVKELFEQPKQAASITLPFNARNKMSSLAASSTADAYLLPEDRHFNSKQLLRLFLKPRVAINMRRKGQQGGADGFGADAPLWGDADADADADEMRGSDGGMPFDTQFFHDADDGYDANGGDLGGLDDSPANATVGGDAEDEELTQTLQALNRVKPEYVNYAKKAKRVDVKKLKENIWKELGILGTTSEDPAEMAAKVAAAVAEADGDESMASNATEAAGTVKTFQSVLSGLQKAYTQDKMEEISTSFCFICLLHLANEEGLAISTGTEDKIEALRAKKGRNSTAPTKGDLAGGLFGKLAAGRVMRTSSEDDDLGGEEDEHESVDGEEGYEEDELRVGRLSSLRIMKDPRAYRSA